MKKIAKMIIILLSVVTLSGCGKSSTIEEKRTIVLNVDSDVTPSFSSNFGSGSYDAETGKYTHTIEYIKDLYIYLSYKDMKTKRVYIPTEDMKESIITRDVEFGEILDAEVEITIEGVKTLEGLEISNLLNYSNLSIKGKNKFKFTLPSREQDYNFKFTLPGYQEFEIILNKEDLISGLAKINTIAITNEQVYIAFDGSNYEYEIYSINTNELISSGNMYGHDNSDLIFVTLDNTDSYYVKTSPNGGRPRLYKVPMNENMIIYEIGESHSNYKGYLSVEGENWQYYLLYDKVENILTNNSYMDISLENYGLLVKNSENRWFYLDNLENRVTTENSWEYKYAINYDDMEEVNFNVTKIDFISGELLSSGESNDFNIEYDISARYENKVFFLTLEEIKEGMLNVDLYDKDNNKIDTISSYIHPTFSGDIFSGTIKYKEKTIPYIFPVFVEDLVYENGEYRYAKQTIDINETMLSVKLLDSNGNIHELSYNDYIMDEEQEVIMGTMIGNCAYFELHVGNFYKFKYNGVEYSFIVMEADVNAGQVILVSDEIKKVVVKVPRGHHLVANSLQNIKFYPNEEGIVFIPVGEQKDFAVSISNGYVENYIKNIITEDESIVELSPFFVIEGGSIIDGDNYYVQTYTGSNGIDYHYIYSNGDDEFVNEITTSIENVNLDGTKEMYRVNLSEFGYDENYNAYYYNFEDTHHSDHIVEFVSNYQMDQFIWSNEYYRVSYYDFSLNNSYYKAYVTNGTRIEYKNYNGSGSKYTFTNADEKYLKVEIKYNNGQPEIYMVPVTN